MSQPSAGVSLYFFDFDDNLMRLDTPVFVKNTVTGEVQEIATGELASVLPQLGAPGRWRNHALFEGSYARFRDPLPSEAAWERTPGFVQDVETALARPASHWQGPSWELFRYACGKQRPVSLITARGHEPETLKQGIRLLVERGFLSREPNYHTVFPVGNERVRREELGDPELALTTPALKKRAILQSVERALVAFGADPPHRFGMSDDDPRNVRWIIAAMCECKKKHPDKRFFVIDTHFDAGVKLEVFPMDFPVTGKPDLQEP